jgi:hypothetical protein
VPVAVPSDHPAFDVLAELGGLTVGKCGAGIECATSDLAFEWSDFADDTVTWWGQRLRTHLIKVAEYHHVHGELYVDSAERCFSASLVDDNFSFIGDTFGEGVERLLLGKRSRPMLRPNQKSVIFYGEEYRRGDPRIYPWR